MSKKEETTQENQEKKKGRSTRLVMDWINDNIIDDVEENYQIALLSIENIGKKFNALFKDPELLLAFYGLTFESIMDVLIDHRKTHSSYCINMCDRFEIGYTDAEQDDDTEKMGSFVPYIYDCNSGKKTYDNTENQRTIEICVSWLSQNCIEQTDIIKTISTKAQEKLKEKIDFHVPRWEIIIPCFIIIHESMLGYLTLKQAESGEYRIMINFAGCYDVFVSLDENKDVVVEYCPTIKAKLDTKSDGIATSRYE